jgi:hypothetical protein
MIEKNLDLGAKHKPLHHSNPNGVFKEIRCLAEMHVVFLTITN